MDIAILESIFAINTDSHDGSLKSLKIVKRYCASFIGLLSFY